MNDADVRQTDTVAAILRDTAALGFGMVSEPKVGAVSSQCGWRGRRG